MTLTFSPYQGISRFCLFRPTHYRFWVPFLGVQKISATEKKLDFEIRGRDNSIWRVYSHTSFFTDHAYHYFQGCSALTTRKMLLSFLCVWPSCILGSLPLKLFSGFWFSSVETMCVAVFYSFLLFSLDDRTKWIVRQWLDWTLGAWWWIWHGIRIEPKSPHGKFFGTFFQLKFKNNF